MIKIDLHVHTRYSDGNGSIDQVIKIARMKGLNAIAITDHDTTLGGLKAQRLASDIIVIPGYETATDAGHILVLGVRKPLKTRNYVDLIEQARDCGAVTILAHPVTGPLKMHKWSTVKPNAVEVINALYPLPRLQVFVSKLIAAKLGLPSTGGSDSHEFSTVGDAYTVVDSDMDYSSILEALMKGQMAPLGSSTHFKIRLKFYINNIKYRSRFVL